MKKILCTLILVSSLTLAFNSSQAQAWEKNSKVLSLGFGASQFFHIDGYYYANSQNIRNWYWPVTGQINFQGEFGIHKYVGLGFTTGLGGRAGWLNGYAGEVNLPIGMIANFHFYQLIADKTKKSIHSDKLDIYVGANLGSGVAVTYYKSVTRIVPLAFGGLQVGVRYYFAPKVAFNAELGWGKSIINLGFAFKLNATGRKEQP